MQNLNFVINKINLIKSTDNFIKKSKIQRIEFYKINAQKLENINFSNIENYNFKLEIVNHAYNLRKLSLLPKILKNVVNLEVHINAPELNKIHFTKNRFLKVNKNTSIDSALHYLIETLSIQDLKTLTN
jgi:hypothetical protein